MKITRNPSLGFACLLLIPTIVLLVLLAPAQRAGNGSVTTAHTQFPHLMAGVPFSITVIVSPAADNPSSITSGTISIHDGTHMCEQTVLQIPDSRSAVGSCAFNLTESGQDTFYVTYAGDGGVSSSKANPLRVTIDK